MGAIIWAPTAPAGIIIREIQCEQRKTLRTIPLDPESIAAHFESFGSSFELRALTGVAHV